MYSWLAKISLASFLKENVKKLFRNCSVLSTAASNHCCHWDVGGNFKPAASFSRYSLPLSNSLHAQKNPRSNLSPLSDSLMSLGFGNVGVLIIRNSAWPNIQSDKKYIQYIQTKGLIKFLLSGKCQRLPGSAIWPIFCSSWYIYSLSEINIARIVNAVQSQV